VTAQVGSAVCSNCLLPLRAIDAMTDGARSAGATSATRREVGAETLRLRFRAGGEVDVRRGASLVLGRDPQVSPAAGTLAEFDNVSRRHAVISVDAGGAAWAEDTRSTNGTFVNGARVPPGTRARLRDRDELRLGSDVVAEVSLLPDEDRQ
jgi:pSer/pThr/pTyr-binding forkhead associated (FHA) protein